MQKVCRGRAEKAIRAFACCVGIVETLTVVPKSLKNGTTSSLKNMRGLLTSGFTLSHSGGVRCWLLAGPHYITYKI